MAAAAVASPRAPVDAIAEVRRELEALVLERERLRERGADLSELEANRLAIAERQRHFAHLAWRCYGAGSGPAPFA